MKTRGFRQTLETAGIEPDEALVLPGNLTAQGGADAMVKMLTNPKPPTAVFSISDEMAIGAVHSTQRMGLSVPDDLSIVGFDDHDLAEFVGLTTVRQDVAALGVAAAEKLQRMIDGEHPATDTVFPTQLMIRATTGPAPS